MLRREEWTLIERVCRGDHDACDELVRTHYRAVYALLAHLGRDVHLAEDLTQETFISAWSSIGSFGGRSSLNTWLSKIAYRKFVDAQRRGRVQAEKAEAYYLQYAVQMRSRVPSSDLDTQEQCKRVYEALGTMEDEDRTLLTLHYLQGLSYRQMASVLEKPTGTIKWQTSRALQRLKTNLNGKSDS